MKTITDIWIALAIYLPLSQWLKPQHNEESVVPSTQEEGHIFEQRNRNSPKWLMKQFYIKINLDLLYLLTFTAPNPVYY